MSSIRGFVTLGFALALACNPAGQPERTDAAAAGASGGSTSTGAAARGDDAGAADDGAEAMIGAWIEAAGGLDVWHRVRDVRYTMTTVWYDPATGEEQRRRPRHVWIRQLDGGFRVRVERTEAEGDYVQVWDGATGWATLDGALLPDTARAVREIPLVAGDLTYWIGLPWKLRDPGVHLRYFAYDDEGAAPGVAVSFGDGVGLHPGDRYWYYFGDPASPLPTELHFLEQGRPPEARERTLWSEWLHADGAVFLGRRLHVDAAGRPMKALLISDVATNQGVSDRLFRRPR